MSFVPSSRSSMRLVARGQIRSGFFGKFGKDSKNSDWFRIYKTFFIPSEAYSIQFLKSKLCIICAKASRS